jgi:hypothetical protein
MNKIQHFVLTRFNLQSGENFVVDKNNKHTQSDDWLLHRFNLFEKYCLPSLGAQTNKKFQWFLFFDKETPHIFRQRINEAKSICPQIKIFYVEGFGDIAATVNQNIDDDTDITITTRIDNDDAFKNDALDVIRIEAQKTQSDLCVNLQFGFSFNGKSIETFSSSHNPFSSLVEHKKQKPYATIFGQTHGKIHKLARVKQITSGPHWLMVVHDRNIVNRMPSEYKAYRAWEWARFKRYLRKYLLPRIRRFFWPAEVKKRYSVEELNDTFNIKL